MNTFPKSQLEKIKALVIEGDTDQAAGLLAEATKSAPLKRYHHLALNLSSRINKLEEKIRKGTINQQDEEVSWNQITDAMIDLLGEMENDLEDQVKAAAAPPPPKPLPKPSPPAPPDHGKPPPKFSPGKTATPSPLKRLPKLFLSLGAVAAVAVAAFLVFPKSPQKPAFTKVEGTVIYQDGEPAASLELDFDHGKKTVETDANGGFKIVLDKASDDHVFLIVRKDGQVLQQDSFLISNLDNFPVPRPAEN